MQVQQQFGGLRILTCGLHPSALLSVALSVQWQALCTDLNHKVITEVRKRGSNTPRNWSIFHLCFLSAFLRKS